jgi:predicted porin
MNKKLIALAVAGVCAAPTVMAQSANPITLYGALRMDLEYVEAGGLSGTADVKGRTRLVEHPNYLGVRGTEDLGGGLKAWFQLETRFDANSVSGAFADRNSGVGLQGNWGSVMVGRWDMPMKQDVGKTDLWGDINRADYTAATMNQGNFSVRAANVAQYWSPNWGGFGFKLAYVPDEARTASITPTMTGASVTWSKGPVYLVYAYEEHKNYTGSNAVVTASGYKEEGNVVGGAFTMGNFKLTGHYGEYKVPVNTTTTNATRLKEKSYYVGGQYTMGKHDLILTWQQAENGLASDGDCDVLGVGWQYNFSKRTKTRLSYAEVNNDKFAKCNFGSGGNLGTTGQDPKGFGITMLHYF